MLKPISEQRAVDTLEKIRSDLRSEIGERYEPRAQSCLTCPTQGACCLDEHFVNVHISRLEAVAISSALEKLPDGQRAAVDARIQAAVERYSLTADGDTFAQTYACPLFEKGIGCLVHAEAKPLPCITHACYERREDLPPDNLLAGAETRVEDLNLRTYGRAQPVLPLPLALQERR